PDHRPRRRLQRPLPQQHLHALDRLRDPAGHLAPPTHRPARQPQPPARLKRALMHSRVEHLVHQVRRVSWALPLVGLIVLLLLPLLGTSIFAQRQIALIAVYALVVAGLNLSFGYAGELALGQAAVMA